MNFTNLKKLNVGGIDVVQLFINGVQVFKAGYKNWVKYSIDTDKSIFNNGQGWIAKMRVRSSGALADADYAAATGFIPVKAGNVIRFTAGDLADWHYSTGKNCIHLSDSSFGSLGSFTTQPAYYGICNASNSIVTTENNISTYVIPNNANIAYLRMSINGNHSDARHGNDLIVTVNEEITD